MKAKHISIWIYCFINIIFWPNRKRRRKIEVIEKRKKKKNNQQHQQEVRQWKKERFCIFVRQTLTDFGFSLFSLFEYIHKKKKSVEDTRNELALLSDHTTDIKQKKKRKRRRQRMTRKRDWNCFYFFVNFSLLSGILCCCCCCCWSIFSWH